MALETLKDVEEIGGFAVTSKPESGDKYVFIDHPSNTIGFTIQNGPIKEVGVNGCQLETLIHAAAMMVSGLNKKFESSYNNSCLSHLELALGALNQRKVDRQIRGVEGFSRK